MFLEVCIDLAGDAATCNVAGTGVHGFAGIQHVYTAAVTCPVPSCN
jgi:hypothetical protein